MESHESISKALDTHTNGKMTHIQMMSFRNRVIVDINDPVQVECNSFGDVVEFLQVVFPAGNKCGESEGSKIAYSCLVGGGVLNDLSAEIRRVDSTKVLLVRFAFAKPISPCPITMKRV